MKKSLSLLIILMLCFTAFTLNFKSEAVFAPEEVTSKLNSDVCYLESLDEGTVLFDKNADKKVPVAGFIKLIAAVVAIEKWGNLDEIVEVTDKNRSLVKYDYGIRTAGYKAGEKVKKSDLIKCMVVYSANDAASIVAYEISGSLEGFIAEMQALMEKIGCKNTVIKNIHGFDEKGQYTTAADMADFLRYALGYPIFSDAVSTQKLIVKAYNDRAEKTVTANNKLMNSSIADYYHKSVTGGKYTMTDEAGECVAAISNLDGYSYLTVVMGGKLMNVDKDDTKENTCFNDAKNMLDWVYNNIRYRVVVSPEQSIAFVDVKAGKDTDKVRLVPSKELSALVPSNVSTASVSFEIVEGSVPSVVTAPVKAGAAMGQAVFFYAGQEVARVDLMVANDVERSTGGYIMSVISSIVGSPLFLVLSIVIFLACALYLAFLVCKYLGITDEKQIMAFITKGKKKTAASQKNIKTQPKKNTSAKRPQNTKSTGKAKPTANTKRPQNTKRPPSKNGK